MARRIRKVASRKTKPVSFKVSEDFFKFASDKRDKFFDETGIFLSQPALSTLILKSAKENFIDLNNLDGINTKPRKKKKSF